MLKTFLMMQLIKYKPKKMSQVHKFAILLKLFFFVNHLHANVQSTCNVKANYCINLSKIVIALDRPLYAQAQVL